MSCDRLLCDRCLYVIEKKLSPKEGAHHVFAAPCDPGVTYEDPGQVSCSLEKLALCQAEYRAGVNNEINRSVMHRSRRGYH